MLRPARLLVLSMVLAFPMAAGASVPGSRSPFVDCYPQVIVCQPVPTVTPCPPLVSPPSAARGPTPRSAARSQVYAAPTAAPPSTLPFTAPPPLAIPPKNPGNPNPPPTTIPPPPVTKPPQVSEPQVYHDTYAVGPRDPNRTTADRCTVGFWNLTDQDLTVAVQNQSRELPKGKSLSLDLPREFVWQLKGRELHTERVATGEAGMEIVLRKYKD